MITGSVQNSAVYKSAHSPYLLKPQIKLKPAFKGHIGVDNAVINGIDLLVHETAFFRDFKTKLYVLEHIKKNFADNKIIKIVVGACSTGEEAVTLSMMLNAIKEKVSILGIDLSQKVIKKAKNRQYEFHIPDDRLIDADGYSAFQDTFLTADSKVPLTSSQDSQKKLFYEFFEPAPLGNNLLRKIKNFYNKYFYSNIVKDHIKFNLKAEKALNCNFVDGDIRNLNEITKGEKSDVIFFSNALYHLVTYIADDGSRIMRIDSEDVIRELAKEFRENLNINGLICFGEEEAAQIPKIEVVSKVMQDVGFEPLNATSKHGANIFRKTG